MIDERCSHSNADRVADHDAAERFVCPDCYGVSDDSGPWDVRRGAWLRYGNGTCNSFRWLLAQEAGQMLD